MAESGLAYSLFPKKGVQNFEALSQGSEHLNVKNVNYCFFLKDRQNLLVIYDIPQVSPIFMIGFPELLPVH